MRIIGTFRSVDLSDLQRFAYAEDRRACERDRANLDANGLIEHHRFTADPGSSRQVVALTPPAQRLLVTSQPREEGVVQQRYYSGFGKPRDLEHDLALYPMVERERARLDAQDLRITRVVLDAELKSSVLSAWGAPWRGQNRHAWYAGLLEETKRAIAEAHGLTLIGDLLQFPDVRLELERPDGEKNHVDLELVTRHYRADHLSLKAQARFRFYTLRNGELIEHIL